MPLVSLAIDGRRYGIDVRDVVHVVPRPPLRPVDGAPPWHAGVFFLRGDLVPVVDLGLVTGAAPAAAAYSTRVIVVRAPGVDDTGRLAGLLAEHVTDVIDLDVPAGAVDTGGSALGPLVRHAEGELIQVIRIDRLLNDEIRGVLFA